MSRRNDRVGEQHGVFLVLSFAGTYKDQTLWLCECQKCGALSNRQNRYFRKDRPVPTQCIKCKGNLHAHFKGHGEIPASYFSRVEKQAKDRDYICEVTIEYLWELFVKQERKCYITGLPLSFKDSTASLDRVDNTKGYIKGNVAFCHKEINRMKGSLTLSDFLFYSRSVTKVPNVPEVTKT